MTGSTTVDSNFLLAHKEQLDEVFQVYLDDINPFIVQFEILKNEFPIELQNEIRAMYGHLARAAIAATPEEAERNLAKIKSHTKRALLDCYKYSCIIFSDQYEEFFRDYHGVDLTYLEDGISRLTDQKGLDLVNYILHELLQDEVQLVVLGVGQRQYEDAFRYFAGRYPEKVSANICFDEPLSHKIYACADMVLVPSLFEPCGLSQMIAMRYGTLPIVRETGGLKDSVIPYNEYTGEGNGFSFANYNAHELLFTIQRAVRLYRDNRPAWENLMRNAFAADFSWDKSAKEYLELYRGLLR